MINIAGAGDARPGYGPLPVEKAPAIAGLSASQRSVLDVLRTSGRPLTLAALSSSLSLHANTLREHLQALERSGVVSRLRAKPEGRGRPAWLYVATQPEPFSGPADYGALAAALATALSLHDHPHQEAVAAGTAWGKQLGRVNPPPTTNRGTAGIRRAVVSLLSDLGFGPETDRSAASTRLTRCPLLEAARLHPDVVCGVHEGIVRGALQQWGDTSIDVTLVPFAEPGACRLHLRQPTGPAGSP